jgi:hypothetical protein
MNSDQKYINDIERIVDNKYLKQQFKIFKVHHNSTIKEEIESFDKTIKKNNFSKSETEYLKFFYKLLHKIDFNIVELGKNSLKLIKTKNLMSLMFLLRGQMELIFFNIYITHKLNFFLKKRNYKELVNLTCRANLASGSNSLNAGILSKKSFILKKIMKKFKDKRIHINDCIRFYKKTDFKKLYLEDGILKRKKFLIYTNGFRQIAKEREEDIEKDIVIDAYDRLCEVIHPTALMINDSQDKGIQIDYKELVLKIFSSHFLYLNLLCYPLKEEVFIDIMNHREKIIENFKKTLE